ncbi:hypothetical protein AU467_12960 [Mesorhizobium loti]|uniref:Uncharacterized protein n=1 Tax=Rhizobium loti TaxID=381 RepID=A0A117N4P2_RHILI|nr:hypothetical protein AU467_12960 [Mesorhizobium loti]
MRSAADKARVCAANNADLYEAVFRAHGLKRHRNPFLWWSESPAPPYYSNMTTLDPDAIEFQHEAVKQLNSALDGPFAVKDGFCRLDLASLGFKLLFCASWTWANPGRATGGTPGRRMAFGWERIHDPDALRAWEDAWAADNPSDRRVFPPAILDNPDIAFFGCAPADGFDAGYIVNRSPGAVGLSNVFAKGVGAATAYQDATRAAAIYADGLPLVGYEHGDALHAARLAGFEPVGGLRVWLRQSERAA